MSEIKKLIERLCPDGVEYKRIDSLFETFSGMTGVSDKWKETGNCQFIDYLNVYNNMRVDVKNLPYATVKNPQQNTLQKGDILLTCASETPDECAMSSVIRDDINEGIFLDDHLFAIRLKSEHKNIVNTAFLNYYMHSSAFRIQVCKKVRGVTRFYITGKPFMSLEIPVPPIEVQSKIVEILDNFTELEIKLEAELEARRKQYEYYRNQLLTFDKVGGARFDVKWMKLREISMYAKERIDGNLLSTDNYVGVENLLKDKGGKTSSSSVPSGNAIKFIPGDILIGNIRPYLKKIWLANIIGGTNGDVLCIRVSRNDLVSSDYLYKCLSSDSFFNYDNSHAKGGKMPRGDKKAVMEYSIPIPQMEEQKRIVSILDRFEALTTDLQSGLPAEIEARRKQYEYYREQLLTFKRKTA